ncbi:adenine glycosylase [Propionicicella superfundia]|uniref:adenine glycosylase n=1 Tax=Propionicicella superfundia TaxID=348582 RepID=UPI00042854A8|nr:adenine glycosylase [Propionicicella superfundia]
MTTIAAPLTAWYAAHARDLPWRRPDCGAWGVLVSEFMLQQTPVTRVLRPWREWLDRWPAPESLAAAPVADAVRLWGTLGYPRRALWLHRTAARIVERHGGVVPRDVADLLELPGVGPYTARAIAVFAYGERHPVVDTNTRRVLARAVAGRSGPRAPSPHDLVAMEDVLPRDAAGAAIVNAAAMELGALVCVARAPRCGDCPLEDRCAWRAAGYPDTGDGRPRQARYEGSDRQARGAVLRVLRDAAGGTVPPARLAGAWPDIVQRDRAVASLLADGLAETTAGGLRLPG